MLPAKPLHPIASLALAALPCREVSRFAATPFFSGSANAVGQSIDVTSIPGFGSFSSGQTWNFQAWYRDANPGVTSNFSDGRSISF